MSEAAIMRRYAELKNQLDSEKQFSYQSQKEIKIKEYQSEIDELLTQYTERHPKVRELLENIENLKNDLKNKGDSYSEADKESNPVYQEIKVELNKTKVEIQSLQIKLKEQENYVKKLNSFIDVMPEVEAKLTELNRDYEVTKTRYLELVERREAAELAQSAGHSTSDVNFRVIEPPVVPVTPSGPNRELFLIGVLVASLGAGLLWAFLRDQLEPTFSNHTQVSSVSVFPILGSVNLYLSPEHRRKRQLQLSYFLSSTLLLIPMFLAVFLLRNYGIALLRDTGVTSLISSIIYIK